MTVINPPGDVQPPTNPPAPTATPPAPVAPPAPVTAPHSDAIEVPEDEHEPSTAKGWRERVRHEREQRQSLRDKLIDRERELATARAQLGSVETLRRGLVEQAVIAAATGRLTDPADALRMIDLSDVDVDAAGKLDSAKIKAKVDALVEAKPYLGTNGAGSAPAKPSTLPGGGARPAGGASFNDLIRQQLRR